MTRIAVFMLIVSLALPVIAQELNDAGGSLTVNGADPVASNPFNIFQGGSVDFEVGGNGGAGFIILGGVLNVPGNTPFPGSNEELNLVQGSAFVIGDGIGNTSGFPGAFWVLGGNGVSAWSWPVNPALGGANIALQAITSDPAAPFGLNLTAAADYNISPLQQVNLIPVLSGSGDDGFACVNLAGAGYAFYGQQVTQLTVGTNGYVAFDCTGTSGDFTESPAEMIAGNLGGALGGSPVVAPLWEDLDMGNNATQQMLLTEDPSIGQVSVSWINADYFSATFLGNLVCTFDFYFGPMVTFDYTGYAAAPPPQEGIVGISDGDYAQAQGLPGGNDTQADVAAGGLVTSFAAPMSFETYFQSFDGLGTTPAEPFDLGGLVMNWIDGTGFGDWIVF